MVVHWEVAADVILGHFFWKSSFSSSGELYPNCTIATKQQQKASCENFSMCWYKFYQVRKSGFYNKECAKVCQSCSK